MRDTCEGEGYRCRECAGEGYYCRVEGTTAGSVRLKVIMRAEPLQAVRV